MNCYHCDTTMESGTAKFTTWGSRQVITHRDCNRDALVDYAIALGCAPDVAYTNEWTDQQLIDAIAAEKLSGEWLARLERLPTDEARRDAVHQLSQSIAATAQHADAD